MMLVYKYLESQYLERFRNEGKLYINTLYNLRLCPHEPRRDELEGKFRLKIAPKNAPDVSSAKTANMIFPNVNFSENLGKNAFTVMPNSTAISDTEIPNAFAFCTSLTAKDELGLKLEYDRFFEITDVLSFADIVLEKLSETECIIGYLADKVTYGIKEKNITGKNKASILANIKHEFWEYCFMKPLKHKDEEEFRIIFLPQFDKPIEPKEIDCVEALKFCRFNQHVIR